MSDCEYNNYFTFMNKSLLKHVNLFNIKLKILSVNQKKLNKIQSNP